MVDWQKRALALSGLLQACHLVSSLARTGIVSQDAMDQSLRSIFVTNPESISEVYEGTRGVRTGLRLASDFLRRLNVGEDVDTVRYVLAAIGLERKLSGRPELLRQLGAEISRVDEARMLAQDGSRALDAQVVSSLARVYESTLSTIEPRIRISGKRNFLAMQENVDRIRALLLAAIRSAVLYHQVGGRRWHLLFARRALLDGAQNYL